MFIKEAIVNKDYQERALYTPMDDAGQTISFAVSSFKAT